MKSKFTFLVTTDNHMGYKEDDHVRRKDSYMAFSEALQIARERDVDFILLGGDLFHMNKPSTSIEHKCMRIIRKHMNAETNRNEVSFRRISGQFSHTEKVSHGNFEDPNLKVPYPIFTIHGNHDDPTGTDAKSVCEKLATCGMLNYFGLIKPSFKEKITIEPIILQKDSIKIALYGIGFVPDVKLRTAFINNLICFKKPPQDTFNVLIVHQNRVPFDKSKHIPDDTFPPYFHLIIRGHEHNTMSPEKLPESDVNGLVYQPGSTVATSLSSMEAGTKKVSYMSVTIKDPTSDPADMFKLDYELIALKCCRHMIFRDIPQKEVFQFIKSKDGRKKLTPIEYRNLFREFICEKITNLLDEYKLKLKTDAIESNDESINHESTSIYSKLHRFDKPLLRLRLEYANKSERFSEEEVSRSFYPEQVANRDIILFKKQKIIEIDGQKEIVTFASRDGLSDDEDDEDFDVINLNEERKDTIDVMIENYFMSKPESQRLKALSLLEYTNAVRSAAEDGNVISKVISKKKCSVFNRYKEVLCSEELAKSSFSDKEAVHRWFLDAFTRADNSSVIASGGDIQHSADSDIEWED